MIRKYSSYGGQLEGKFFLENVRGDVIPDILRCNSYANKSIFYIHIEAPVEASDIKEAIFRLPVYEYSDTLHLLLEKTDILSPNNSPNWIDDDEFYYYCEGYLETDIENKLITFDISKIFRDNPFTNQAECNFRIINDSNSEFKIYDFADNFRKKDFCYLTTCEIDGFDESLTYIKQDCGDLSIFSIDLFNGRLLGTIGNWSKGVAPIKLSAIYNQRFNNTNSVFGKKFASDYEYQIKFTDMVILKDPSGRTKYFLNQGEDQEGFKLYYNTASKLIIRAKSGANYQMIVYLIDSEGNTVKFDYKMTTTNFQKIKIDRIIAPSGEMSIYYYNNNRLVSTRTTTDEVAFSYQTIINYDGNKINNIFYPKENKRLNFYYLNNNITKAQLENLEVTEEYPSFETLVSLEFSYDNNDNIVMIYDTISKMGYSYIYNNDDRVQQVDMFLRKDLNSIEICNHLSIIYENNSAIITDYRGEVKYYYFNVYGQCDTIINNDGVISQDYFQKVNNYNNEVELKFIQTLNSNLLYNSSFESSENIFTGVIHDWQKDGDVLSNVALVKNNSRYSNTVLKVNIQNNESVTIYQQVYNLSEKVYSLQGLIKYHNISNNNLQIEVVSDYPNGNNQSQIIRSINYFNGDSEWQPFIINNIKIPEFINRVTIRIKLHGIDSEILLDNIQFIEGDLGFDYNYIENCSFQMNPHMHKWIVENTTVNDHLIDVYDNERHYALVGKRAFKMTGTTNDMNAKFIKQNIEIEGSKGDELLFNIMGKGDIDISDIFQGFIELHYYQYSRSKKYYFNFKKNFVDWQMLLGSVIAEDNYHTLTIGAICRSRNTMCVGSFNLYRRHPNIDYGYDYKYHQIKESPTNIIHNELNSVILLSDEYGMVNCYEYNNKNQLKVTYNSHNKISSYDYDQNGFEKECKVKDSGDKVIEVFKQNDNLGNVTSYIDYLGNTTNYAYNNLSQIINTIYPNGLSVNSHYDVRGLLEYQLIQLFNSEIKCYYTYDVKRRLSRVETPNNMIYRFVYNDVGNITDIYLNNVILVQYEYNLIINNINTNLITKRLVYKDQVIENLEYHYNKRNRIKNITSDTLDLHYYYDKQDRLVEVEDTTSGYVEYYQYDSLNNTNHFCNNQNISVAFDLNDSNINKKVNYHIEDIYRSYEYEYITDEYENTKAGYLERLAKLFPDDIITGPNMIDGKFGARFVSKNINTDVYNEGLFEMIFKNKTSFLTYDLSEISKISDDKTVYIWIKPVGSYAGESLINFETKSDNMAYRMITLESMPSGFLQIHNLNNEFIAYFNETKIKLNEWNLLLFRIYKDGIRNSAQVSLNGHSMIYNIGDIDISGINRVSIGQYYEFPSNNPEIPLNMPFNICLLSIGISDSLKTAYSFYEEGIKYLNHDLPIIKAGVKYYSQEMMDAVDIVSLNGSLTSLRGKKPLASNEINLTFKQQNNKMFVRDDNRLVYGSYSTDFEKLTFESSKLVYNLDFTNNGFVSIRVKQEYENRFRYLFSFMDGNTIKFGIFLDEDGFLGVTINNTIQHFNRYLSNEWETVRFIYWNGYFRIDTDSGINYELPVNLDLSDTLFILGSTLHNNIAINHFEGKMEKLVFTNWGQLDQNIYDNIDVLANPITITHLYDGFHRLLSETIHPTGKTEISTHYQYKDITGGSVTTPQIISEKVTTGKSINYEYDSMGNITSKTFYDGYTMMEKHSYTYDLIGRLILEKGEDDNNDFLYHNIYEYDSNSNITKRIEKGETLVTNREDLYTYDVNNKDLLTDITINTYQNGIIKETKNRHFIYTNHTNQLKSINNNGIITDYIWNNDNLVQIGTTRYNYNYRGMRTKIIHGNITTQLTYSNENIIQMKRTVNNTNKVIYFNYDETNQLVGLSYKSQEYFYIKDITGNINEIIDSSGRTMVQYHYDTWGKPNKQALHLPISLRPIAEELMELNPFLFKSYYYEEVTGYYSIITNHITIYYDPTIRRYLTSKAITELIPSSLVGLNLYTYSVNSPITINSKIEKIAIIHGGSIAYNLNANFLPFSFANLTLFIKEFGEVYNVFNDWADGISNFFKEEAIVFSLSAFLRFNENIELFSDVLLGISIGLDVLKSIYNNLANDDLTSIQKAASIGLDIAYITIKTFIIIRIGNAITNFAIVAASYIGGLAISLGLVQITGALLIGIGVAGVIIVVGGILVMWLVRWADKAWLGFKQDWFDTRWELNELIIS